MATLTSEEGSTWHPLPFLGSNIVFMAFYSSVFVAVVAVVFLASYKMRIAYQERQIKIVYDELRDDDDVESAAVGSEDGWPVSRPSMDSACSEEGEDDEAPVWWSRAAVPTRKRGLITFRPRSMKP